MTEPLYGAIAAASIVTILIRVLPVILLANRSLPAIVRNWLIFIPPAIFSAIIVNTVLQSPEESIGGVSIALLTTIITFLVGFFFRNLFVIISTSIVAYFFLEQINTYSLAP